MGVCRRACSVGAVAGLLLSGAGGAGAGAVAGPGFSTSVSSAYTFLGKMMDRHASGTTPRLVQSFTGGPLGKQGFTDSETYDDALMIDAYLAEGTSDGTIRAETIGNGLLYVQKYDPAGDGRIRAAYAPKPLTAPPDVRITDKTSDVGNMAWAGMALAQLYPATGDPAYLTGAESIGNWVRANCHDTRGAGGYTGGDQPNGTRIRWKSTEHNIDLYAMFTMLAAEDPGDPAWAADASWAGRFVKSMWQASKGKFYVGTTNDGVTPNTSFQPEDVNSWSYLALPDSAYAASVTWDVKNLAVSAGGFSGVSFCKNAKNAVWFEGTAHLADALELRGAPGDRTQAATYLSDIRYAQNNGPNHDKLGIIAASAKLSDCDGDHYYASLHTGATAWYIMAALTVNPFVLGF